MLIKESKLRQIIKSIIREAYEGNQGYNKYPEYDPTSPSYKASADYTAYNQVNQSTGMVVKDITNSTPMHPSDKAAGVKCYNVSLALDSAGKTKTMQVDNPKWGRPALTVNVPVLNANEVAMELGVPKNEIVLHIEDYLTEVKNPGALNKSCDVWIFPSDNIVQVAWGSLGTSIYNLSTGKCTADNCPI